MQRLPTGQVIITSRAARALSPPNSMLIRHGWYHPQYNCRSPEPPSGEGMDLRYEYKSVDVTTMLGRRVQPQVTIGQGFALHEGGSGLTHGGESRQRPVSIRLSARRSVCTYVHGVTCVSCTHACGGACATAYPVAARQARSPGGIGSLSGAWYPTRPNTQKNESAPYLRTSELKSNFSTRTHVRTTTMCAGGEAVPTGLASIVPCAVRNNNRK